MGSNAVAQAAAHLRPGHVGLGYEPVLPVTVPS